MEHQGLTTTQNLIFGEVAQHPFFSSQFYLTGGTALSAFYLHHRESEDLDFFSENPFDPKEIVILERLKASIESL